MLQFFIIFLITTFVSRYLQYLWKSRNLNNSDTKRRGPLALPFIGNSLHFINKDILQGVLRILKDYESPVCVWIANRLFVGVTDPKDLEIVLNHPNAYAKDFIYKLAIPVFGTGLLCAPVDKWKRIRKLILPLFNQRNLNRFVGICVKQAKTLCILLQKKTLDNRIFFNVHDYTGLCGMDIMCESIIGVSVNAQTTKSDYTKWLDKLLNIICKRVTNIWLVSEFLFNLHPLSKEFRDANKKMNDFTENVIKEKRQEYKNIVKKHAYINDEFIRKNSLLRHMIEISDAGANFTDEEIRMEVNTFMIAGIDTTGNTIAFVLVMLGMFSDIQQQVYEEILDVLGSDTSVEAQDLSKLVYLERVIKETLRLFPPVPLFNRETTGDVQLQNFLVPKESSITSVIFALHRDPTIYINPLKFDPNRFTPEEMAKRHPYSWLPFSGGPRNCIGFKYAIMIIKTVVATAVRKYKFATDYTDISEIDLKFDVILKPTKGHRISVELRE